MKDQEEDSILTEKNLNKEGKNDESHNPKFVINFDENWLAVFAVLEDKGL